MLYCSLCLVGGHYPQTGQHGCFLSQTKPIQPQTSVITVFLWQLATPEKLLIYFLIFDWHQVGLPGNQCVILCSLYSSTNFPFSLLMKSAFLGFDPTKLQQITNTKSARHMLQEKNPLAWTCSSNAGGTDVKSILMSGLSFLRSELRPRSLKISF